MLNELHFLLGMLFQPKHTYSLGAYFLFVEIVLHVLNNTLSQVEVEEVERVAKTSATC